MSLSKITFFRKAYLYYRYYNSFMEEENLYIIMEYAEKGDLYKLIKA